MKESQKHLLYSVLNPNLEAALKGIGESISNGADVNYVYNTPSTPEGDFWYHPLQDKYGDTALTLAIAVSSAFLTPCQWLTVADALLRCGASPHYVAGTFTSPLICAVMFKRENIVNKLLAEKASPNLPDPEGRIPIIEASFSADIRTFSHLVCAGADLFSPSDKGLTPITIVSSLPSQEGTQVIKFILGYLKLLVWPRPRADNDLRTISMSPRTPPGILVLVKPFLAMKEALRELPEENLYAIIRQAACPQEKKKTISYNQEIFGPAIQELFYRWDYHHHLRHPGLVSLYHFVKQQQGLATIAEYVRRHHTQRKNDGWNCPFASLQPLI